MEYRGLLVSTDSYMNLQLASTEEYIDGISTGVLGEVLIRCNNVLYIKGTRSPPPPHPNPFLGAESENLEEAEADASSMQE